MKFWKTTKKQKQKQKKSCIYLYILIILCSYCITEFTTLSSTLSKKGGEEKKGKKKKLLKKKICSFFICLLCARIPTEHTVLSGWLLHWGNYDLRCILVDQTLLILHSNSTMHVYAYEMCMSRILQPLSCARMSLFPQLFAASGCRDNGGKGSGKLTVISKAM